MGSRDGKGGREAVGGDVEEGGEHLLLLLRCGKVDRDGGRWCCPCCWLLVLLVVAVVVVMVCDLLVCWFVGLLVCCCFSFSVC